MAGRVRTYLFEGLPERPWTVTVTARNLRGKAQGRYVATGTARPGETLALTLRPRP